MSKEIIRYYKDIYADCLVMVVEENGWKYFDYLVPYTTKWIRSEPDSSYEREYFLGEGRGCLVDVERKDAERLIAEWAADPYNEGKLPLVNNDTPPPKLEYTKMTDEEIKKRLAGRAAEYHMFIDD